MKVSKICNPLIGEAVNRVLWPSPLSPSLLCNAYVAMAFVLNDAVYDGQVKVVDVSASGEVLEGQKGKKLCVYSIRLVLNSSTASVLTVRSGSVVGRILDKFVFVGAGRGFVEVHPASDPFYKTDKEESLFFELSSAQNILGLVKYYYAS